MFEVWKDDEAGYTVKEAEFPTWCDAADYCHERERYAHGWHFRIVPKEETK